MRSSNDEQYKVLRNDYDNPFVINDEILYINPNWYKDNKDLCDQLIIDICKNVNQETFSLYNGIAITNELIDAICENTNLKNISLSQLDKEGYSLTKEHYLKFKKSNLETVITNGVDDELADNFDSLIEYNQEKDLISRYNYKFLRENEEITIEQTLSENDIKNLKYLSEKNIIVFKNHTYQDLVKVINELKKLEKNNKIIIELHEKEQFNNYLFKEYINYNNIYIYLLDEKYHIKDYLNYEKKLYKMIKETSNLSPFEKYIYTYNIVKKYKKYNENLENKKESRDLYKILFNDYMVCVGFSEMLSDLLKKQGINNIRLSTVVDTSYDGVKKDEVVFSEEKVVEKGYHARNFVHIIDEKYGINGFYIADPTWDNDMEKDLYNYLAITNDESSKARRYLFNGLYQENGLIRDYIQELFDINNMDEYVKKIKFITNHKKTNVKLNKLLEELIKYINALDPQYIKELKEKYPNIENLVYSLKELPFPFMNNNKESLNRQAKNIIFEIGEHILSKVNKEISGYTIIEAVENVYKNAYGYEVDKLNEKMLQIIKDNKKAQESNFPTRYKINEDGSREVIMNETNKFDLEYTKKTR